MSHTTHLRLKAGYDPSHFDTPEVSNEVFAISMDSMKSAELMATRYNDLLDLVEILMAEQKPSIRAMRQLVKIRRP